MSDSPPPDVPMDFPLDPESAYSLMSGLTSNAREHPTKIPEYVMHTSSIPLSTTIDSQSLMANEEIYCMTVSEFHGSSARLDQIAVCSKRRCMHVSTNSKVRHACLRLANCPCITISKERDIQLSPICWSNFIKSQGIEIQNMAEPEDKGLEPDIDPEKVLICYDSQSIFDESYSSIVRASVRARGFNHVTNITHLLEVLTLTYWYSRHQRDYKLNKLVMKCYRTHGFQFTLKFVKQTLHTINGLIIKKMMAFPGELSFYKALSIQTVLLFKELMDEYMAVEPPAHSIFGETKSFFQSIKSVFLKENSVTERMSFLSYEFKSKALKRLFSTEFKLLSDVVSDSVQCGRDYTQTLSWVHRCSMLLQTRNMGYLPQHLAREKAKEFRDKISRKREPISVGRKRLIWKSVVDEIKNYIPRNYLKGHGLHLMEVLNKIELDVVQAASSDTNFSDGGRLEDARATFRLICSQNWRIPVRSLENLDVLENRYYDLDSQNLAEPLFWFSFQLFLNSMVRLHGWPKIYYVRFEVNNESGYEFEIGEEFLPDCLEAAIVHINEPAKLRNLVKSSSYLSWFLSPGSKLAQAVLALVPEHYAGLSIGNQGWSHTNRISGETTESTFMYKNRGVKEEDRGKIDPRVLNVFKDWRESTDFISKSVGAAHLDCFLTYIGFPKAYKSMILLTLVAEQRVKETYITPIPGGEGESAVQIQVNWTGSIVEGFMMGNQFTKTILHLVHASEKQVATRICQKWGIHFDRKGYEAVENFFTSPLRSIHEDIDPR